MGWGRGLDLPCFHTVPRGLAALLNQLSAFSSSHTARASHEDSQDPQAAASSFLSSVPCPRSARNFVRFCASLSASGVSNRNPSIPGGGVGNIRGEADRFLQPRSGSELLPPPPPPRPQRNQPRSRDPNAVRVCERAERGRSRPGPRAAGRAVRAQELSKALGAASAAQVLLPRGPPASPRRRRAQPSGSGTQRWGCGGGWGTPGPSAGCCGAFPSRRGEPRWV